MNLRESFLLFGLLLAVGVARGDDHTHHSTSHHVGASRNRRDLANDALDAVGSLGVGEKYLEKFRKLINGVPPKMQDALIQQDFSNVTAQDMRSLNISILEYLPPKILKKLNVAQLSPVIEALLDADKPMAMGRVMSALGDKMDTNTLLDKIHRSDKSTSADVILYTALSKVGDKGGLTSQMLDRLRQKNLLVRVPEEQLMKVSDPNVAQDLLAELYGKKTGEDSNDLDDQALAYKLAETGFGKAETWGDTAIKAVSNYTLSLLPAQFLKDLSPTLVQDHITQLRETKYESALQGNSITDLFLKSMGVNNADGTGKELDSKKVFQLGDLAAFINPSLANDKSILSNIIEGCENLNLPAPLKAVTGLLSQQVGEGKAIKDWRKSDFAPLRGALLKNSPPSVVAQAMETHGLDQSQVKEMVDQGKIKGFFSHPFFQGIVAQVASYAVKLFQGNVPALPAPFMKALGIKGIKDITDKGDRDIKDDVIDKIQDNPDALDDAQKALLIKRIKGRGIVDDDQLPPEFRAMFPRGKNDMINPKDLEGLPSESELRLAYRWGEKLTLKDLEREPKLIGTLRPKQVMDMDLEQIPAVLALVRQSKDGPQQQTLEALSKKFGEYVRSKSEDYESEDKKLLKYITAAEVAKMPGTVLAYFIDARQTSKLPPEVRKEIMIAMGELSRKDHATIPSKTREQIILQGLAAIDKMTGNKKIDVTELAAIGVGVADLPPDRIENLSPVATEQALEIIKGTADDDDDRLKIRACLTPDQRKAWRNKIVGLYGDPSKWNSVTVSSLCCMVGLLNEDDLTKIAPDALATCRCVSDAPAPSHLREVKTALEANCRHELGQEDTIKKTLQKVKSEIAFDLDDLESQIVSGRRRKRSTANKDQLTCFKVRVTGSAAPFSKDQLSSLDKSEIDDCLYELGVDPLPLDHARILWNKLVESREGVSNLRSEDILYAGHVLSGIQLGHVDQLDLSNWDLVFPFGKTEGLTKNVLEKLATRVEEMHGRGQGLRNFDMRDLVVTKNILCGFSPDKLNHIQSEAFREALPVLRSLDPHCEQTRLGALAVLTTRKEIFGDQSKWTAADLRGVGIFLVGLPPRVIESIPPEAFTGVTPTVASALPPTLLATLSPEQVENLPMFSAQAMSSPQKESLTPEARAKISSGPIVSYAPSSHTHSSTLFTLLSLSIATLFARSVLL